MTRKAAAITRLQTRQDQNTCNRYNPAAGTTGTAAAAMQGQEP